MRLSAAQTDDMKKRLIAGAVLVISVAVAGLLISSCRTLEQRKSSPVVIEQYGILIPGTKISKADEEEMNKILRAFDKKLYRVATYENTKRIGVIGSLEDMVMAKEAMSQIAANVSQAGFTRSSIQIGVGKNPTRQQSEMALGEATNPSPTPVGGTRIHPTTHYKASEEMVKRLTPILDRYRRQ